ncbi:hypothetical protein SAMN04488020_106219 [Palleronia marisminoris]|uniref:Uncharacterized protein n=1 Tax=Palleronia marisminoris TaxID=315423 RepID=A0A1Y5T2S7_9RHOB|nr:DUF6478 family protein [Palleronia marisminoris]SFH09333.1 hypothetical protein SAMN04488020_106219 [Palleronia marisminoris]SLN52507.1 hypothetical protein PAM7066_02454 [Palleronia marisminoris]
MRLSVGRDARAHRRELRRWEALADRIDGMDAVALAATRQQAMDLRAALDRTLALAERRLSSAVGQGEPEGPRDSDWVWRPSLFRTRLPVPGHAGVTSDTPLGDAAKVFHDCTLSEISVSQRPGLGRAAAPFVLAVEVLDFEGSFLSLAVDLPPAATEGLTLSHIIQLSMTVEAERPIAIFARLNVKHGPNVEQMVRELDLPEAAAELEFDLAYSGIAEARAERAWIDIIFDDPRMNRVEFGDMVVSRRLRAEV